MEPPSPHPWQAFAVAATGTLMSTLDAGIVNVALPVIAERHGADLTFAQWAISGYLLVITCLLPLCGRLGDMYGRRVVFSTGFLVFGVASMLCGAAPSLGALVAARLLQGVGAAMLMANGPALIMTAFPGPERGRALGFQGMVVALGSLAGPAVGGLILEAFGWRFGFYVNAPIVAAGILASLKVLPRPAASAREPLDAAGALLFAAGMLGLLLGLSHGREWGFVSPKTLGCLALAALALPLFAARERRIQTPMIDFALLLHRPFLTGNLAALLSFMALFANAILLPFYLHDELSVAPARIGLVLAVLPLTMSVAAPLSGFLSERRNFALFSGAGLCGSALGLLVQAGLAPDSPLWRVILGQVLLGAGVGLFQSPNNNSVLSSAPPEKSGQAGGILALTRNLGMIGGIALAVFTFETARGLFGEFIFGFRAALGLGSLLALTGAAVSFSRRKDFRRPD